MPLSDARKRANAKYAKANVKQVRIKFYPAETDLYEWTKAQRTFRATSRLSSAPTWRRVGEQLRCWTSKSYLKCLRMPEVPGISRPLRERRASASPGLLTGI